jgi:transaldolase
MANSPILKVREFGQSIWIDYLSRDLLESNELKHMIDKYGLGGLTSNPSIFEKAIAGGDVYNANIEAGIKDEKSAQEIYESLIFEDVQRACDLFRPIYEQTGGKDGFVSIEVSPELARDTRGTIEEARRFFHAIARDNVMIKIPGTLEGIAAVEQAISEGINVNITLLFSVENYMQAAWAYMRGLQTRVRAGLPIDSISSVASFFLSRIDTKVDDRLEARLERFEPDSDAAKRIKALKGKVAIANAKLAYQRFKELISSDRWQELVKYGANVQRLLWASTSTKDPDYSDVMYVNELVGPHTVNTMPTSTLEACADHCEIVGDRVEEGLAEAQAVIDSLSHPDVDINLDTVMEELLEEGIEKFNQPFHSLIASLEEKISQLQPAEA